MKILKVCLIMIVVSCQPQRKNTLSLCDSTLTIALPEEVKLHHVPSKIFGDGVWCIDRYQNMDTSIVVDLEIRDKKIEISEEFLTYHIDRLNSELPRVQIIKKSISTDRGINTIKIVYELPDLNGDGGYGGIRIVFNTPKGYAMLDMTSVWKNSKDKNSRLENVKFISHGIKVNDQLN